MSSGILDKLKIKPNPEKNEDDRVEIKFNNDDTNINDNTDINDDTDINDNNKKEVFLNTRIIDKIDTNEDDREEMLKKLGRQIPIGRVAEPDDVAFAVLYLGSDESGFVTGSELKIDGGISAM